MLVKKIKCVNFRNIGEIEIEPINGMNIICGENAQGKTNLIESIWLFTGAKSFRKAKDSAYLNLNSKKGFCELDFVSKGTEMNAKMIFEEKRNAFLNEKQLSNPSKLAGNFNAIVFSPNDLSLIKDGPVERRNFLDLGIGQLYPSYISILRDYNRALVQRNQIIKEFKYDGSLSVMLDVFEEEIAVKGEKIILQRKKYLEKLKQYIPKIYEGLSSGREEITAEYICSVKDKNLLECLRESRKDDMFTGVTSVGPHRDDIEFKVNGLNARNYGSQGQKRSVALAVKLAQGEVINDITGEFPVCLLDDVMSELDPSRQNYILNHIKNWQSFLTCCDPSDFSLLKQGKIIKIHNGAVEE